MPKTKGGVVGRGLSDSLVVQFSINKTGDDTKTGFTSGTAADMVVGFAANHAATRASGSRQVAFTLHGKYHLDRVVITGRGLETTTLATTLIVNDGASVGNHGDAGMNVRVQKAEAATPRTFLDIVDNSVNGADVSSFIRYPMSATTAIQPRTITYRGEPQVRGAGSGWTGATADDFSVGDRLKIRALSSEVVTTVDHFYVYCILSALD